MYCQGDLVAVTACDLEYLLKYVDRYVSHFLDTRFFGSVLAVIMFLFLSWWQKSQWLYFKRQYQYL